MKLSKLWNKLYKIGNDVNNVNNKNNINDDNFLSTNIVEKVMTKYSNWSHYIRFLWLRKGWTFWKCLMKVSARMMDFQFFHTPSPYTGLLPSGSPCSCHSIQGLPYFIAIFNTRLPQNIPAIQIIWKITAFKHTVTVIIPDFYFNHESRQWENC